MNGPIYIELRRIKSAPSSPTRRGIGIDNTTISDRSLTGSQVSRMAVIGAIGADTQHDVPEKMIGVTAAAPAAKHSWIEVIDDDPGELLNKVKAYLLAAWCLVLAVFWEVCDTIFSTKNLNITNDRVGLTRSAILLVLFIAIHAVKKSPCIYGA